MNFISALSWAWKALRGHSVTFAVMMACALLGVSVLRALRQGLGALHVPWLATLLLPAMLIGLLAKKERTWIPDEGKRKRWARSIVGGSVVLAIVIALLTPDPVAAPRNDETSSPAQSGEATRSAPVRPRGPSGK